MKSVLCFVFVVAFLFSIECEATFKVVESQRILQAEAATTLVKNVTLASQTAHVVEPKLTKAQKDAKCEAAAKAALGFMNSQNENSKPLSLAPQKGVRHCKITSLKHSNSTLYILELALHQAKSETPTPPSAAPPATASPASPAAPPPPSVKGKAKHKPKTEFIEGFSIKEKSDGTWVNPYASAESFKDHHRNDLKKIGMVDASGNHHTSEFSEAVKQAAQSKNIDLTTIASTPANESTKPSARFSTIGATVGTPLEPTQENCQFYFQQAASSQMQLAYDWQTGVYAMNAYCACMNTPNAPNANSIRGCLQQTMKDANANGITQFSTQDIYDAHVHCYRGAACPCGPAPYLAWIGVTNVPLKLFGTTPIEQWFQQQLQTSTAVDCSLVGWSIDIAGSCNGCTYPVIGFQCIPCSSF